MELGVLVIASLLNICLNYTSYSFGDFLPDEFVQESVRHINTCTRTNEWCP